MRFERSTVRAAPWSIAFLVGSALLSGEVAARNMLPGEAATVAAGDAVEVWTMRSAQLAVTPGAATNTIEARAGSFVSIDGGTVSSTSRNGLLLESSKGIINNAIITASGPSTPQNAAYGLNLNIFNAGTGSSSAVVTNSQITGVGRGLNAFHGADVSLTNSTVKGNGGMAAVGPVAGGVGLVLGGSSAFMSDSSVVGANNGAVLVSALKGFDRTGSHLLLTDGSSITGETGSAILVSRLGPVNEQATIDVTNGSRLSGGNGVILEVENQATAAFNVRSSQLTGDVDVKEDAAAHLTLADNAHLTGKITNGTTLSVDQSSTWTMEGDSTVGALALNGGTVDLRGVSEGFHTLTLGQLSGAGTFALGTDLAQNQSDFLNVTGAASGSHQLLVENTGTEPQVGAADQHIVHTGEGSTSDFAVIGGQVDFGTFAYELEQRDNDWFLVQKQGETGPIVTPGARAVIGLFSAAPTVWYGESATLRSRMGELRNGNDEGGGWIRTYGNKTNLSAGGGVAYKQTQRGISLGADAPVPSSNGQWLLGVMGGYSESDLDLKAGTTGKVDSYYLGAYSTWLAEDGFYVDALIKANRFKNTSQVRMSDGQKAKGSYNNTGIGASIEVGKHIKLEDNWYVEPFAQGSGLLVGGENYQLDNGMRASSNKADSLLGKVGTYVGRSFPLDDGGFVQPYVKVAGAHEFVKSNQVKINDNRFTNDLSGSRIELGTGISAQLTDVLQVHADVDYMKGRNIEQPWGVNVGLRYNW